MQIVVQKFGGTSVATPERRRHVVDRVRRAVAEGACPVVVVSALGRTGDPYATDTLLSLVADQAGYLEARDCDLLLSCGEIIASVMVATELRARGLAALALTGGQAGLYTDAEFGGARILRVDPATLRRHLESGRIPVVAGFQGVTDAGDVTTLGRGGSDTTAAALGGALRASVVEIYTDVDGVKTADPRIVPAARTLAVTTYDEVAQMAHHGARVIHPQAVEIAMQKGVPLRIRSTFSDAPGTLVTYSLEAAGIPWLETPVHGTVTAVTHVPALAQCTVVTDPEDRRALSLFRLLADAAISVDLINVSPDRKVFCVEERKAEKARSTLQKLDLEPQVRGGCAKVSVVGAGMRGRPGVMAAVVEALEASGVVILQTADSHVTISCLVAAEDVEVAVRALHRAFGLEGAA